MAKIIEYIKTVESYYEDYRQGGWSRHKELAYKCGNCNRDVNKYNSFCPHCGTALTGIKPAFTAKYHNCSNCKFKTPCIGRDNRNRLFCTCENYHKCGRDNISYADNDLDQIDPIYPCWKKESK